MKILINIYCFLTYPFKQSAKTMRILFILLAFIFLTSCNDGEREIKSTSKSLSISIDSISITIDSTFLQYYRQTSFNKTNGKLYGYNSALHRIDYLSINDKKNTIGFIQLQKEGPHGIELPIDIYVTNDNEIFLITNNNIIKINSEGEIISKNGINSNSNKEAYNHHNLFPSQDSGFEYRLDDRLFYILNTNMEFSKRKNPKKYYENSRLISSYNYNMDELTELDIPYPKEFQEKDFGFNNLPFVHLDTNYIYYSFSPLPDLYRYHILTKEITTYKVDTKDLPYYKSDYKDLSTNAYSMSLNTFTDNSNFGSLLSTNDFIIRIYLSSTLEHKINSNNNQNPKETALQIFDKDLQLLKTVNINNALGFASNFSDGNTLYFQIEALNENEIRFLKLELSSNNN